MFAPHIPGLWDGTVAGFASTVGDSGYSHMKNLSDCRVLLVDDAKANLDILVEGLKNDHKLSIALNGEMALQIAARTRRTWCCSTL